MENKKTQESDDDKPCGVFPVPTMSKREFREMQEAVFPSNPEFPPKVQKMANYFNEAYIKAAKTCMPADWHEAALLGRQLVIELSAEKIIKDNFDC